MADLSHFKSLLTRIQSILSVEHEEDSVEPHVDQRLVDNANDVLGGLADHMDTLQPADSSGPSSTLATPASGGASAPVPNAPEPIPGSTPNADGSFTAPGTGVDMVGTEVEPNGTEATVEVTPPASPPAA